MAIVSPPQAACRAEWKRNRCAKPRRNRKECRIESKRWQNLYVFKFKWQIVMKRLLRIVFMPCLTKKVAGDRIEISSVKVGVLSFPLFQRKTKSAMLRQRMKSEREAGKMGGSSKKSTASENKERAWKSAAVNLALINWRHKNVGCGRWRGGTSSRLNWQMLKRKRERRAKLCKLLINCRRRKLMWSGEGCVLQYTG